MVLPRWIIIAAALAGGLAPAFSADKPELLRSQLALATADEDTLARIELLRRIVGVDPNDQAAHRELVELWLAVKDYDLAEATLNAWPSAPADLVALTRAAILRHRDNNPTAAANILRAYLATEPRDLAAHEALVDALLVGNDFAAQVEALDALLALKPGATHLLNRANAKLRLGDYGGALADARAAQALEPDNSDVKRDLPTYERLEEALAALPPLDAALARNPNDPATRLTRAWWLRYGGLNDRSLADSKAALVDAPDSIAARVLHDRTRYLLGQISLEEARDHDLVDVARPIALETLQKLYDLDVAAGRKPSSAPVWRQRARTLNEAEQYRLAARDAEAAIALAPRDSAAGLELLFATAQLGQDPAPILRRIEAMKPPRADLALAYAHLADLYFRQSNFPLALDFADRSLGQRETAYVLKVKAATLMRLGRRDEGTAALTRANALPQ